MVKPEHILDITKDELAFRIRDESRTSTYK